MIEKGPGFQEKRCELKHCQNSIAKTDTKEEQNATA